MKIDIFVGHFGSGKTEVALNFAIKNKVDVIIDMDTVNPYFRTLDARGILTEHGINVIAPEYANTNIDMPTLPANILSAFSNTDTAVFDVGGDDEGATVLGVYKQYFDAKGYNMYFVANISRPLTCDCQSICEYIHDIERSSRLKISGLVNNTHLMEHTTNQCISDGAQVLNCVSQQTGIPIAFTAVTLPFVHQIQGKVLEIDRYLDLHTPY